MKLHADLKRAKSEEDVKDIYIKALGLKSYTKGLIDIQTKEVWFEAKIKGGWTLYEMFTQLLYYVQVALDEGVALPPILAVVDTEKAAIMRSADIVPFLRKKTVKWGKSASNAPQAAVDEVSAQIGTKFVAFRIETDGLQFVTAIKEAIRTGKIIRTQITPDNLKQVFDEWVLAIGQEIDGVDEDQYNLLFFADVMHDGSVSTHKGLPAQLLFRSKEPVFQLGGKLYELNSPVGYERFWQVYDRPPQASYRNYLLERRDSLIPTDERMFRGAFYTPLHVVDRAYDFLNLNLGKNWQKNYRVWDMCCGVGNLEVKHGNHRNLFMSTLDQSDVDVMKSTNTCPSAHRFQYDYLNDDIADDGSIDYSLTNKVPADLRSAIAKGERILVLINPPYAEGMNAGTGVAETRVGRLIGGDIGYARRELFVQFLLRIKREIPNAVIAMFSKMKYVNSPNFGRFRDEWTAKYLGGFVIPSRTFDGLKGNFPIGFLIWDTGKKHRGPLEIEAEILDRKGDPKGAKRFYAVPKERLLNLWFARPKPNDTPALPLQNALTPTNRTDDVRGTRWADNGIGGMICNGSDLQHSGDTVLFSSPYCSAGGFIVTKDNLARSAVVFTTRRIIRQTWLNDRDQFLIPTETVPTEFMNDCLIWMLFSNRNLAVGADGLRWNGKDWSLVNHFIPFTETEVGAFDRFESDFMSTHLATLKLSKEATEVMDEGRKVWAEYFDGHRKDDLATRTRLKLGRPDVGWYQIREALKARAERGLPVKTGVADIEKAYAALSAKIEPDIYALGFLRA